MTYQKKFDKLETVGLTSEPATTLWWILAIARLTFKALDKIIQRLDDIQNRTKPQAVIDEAYKNKKGNEK